MTKNKNNKEEGTYIGEIDLENSNQDHISILYPGGGEIKFEPITVEDPEVKQTFIEKIQNLVKKDEPVNEIPPTTIVNLIGASNSRKTTTAAELFAKLKRMNKKVEFTQEFVKKFTWLFPGAAPDELDQSYVFGRELRQQKILLGKVDFIISDSPLILSAFYHELRSGETYMYDYVSNVVKSIETKYNVKMINFFLGKTEDHEAYGRWESKEEAFAIQDKLKEWLSSHAINCIDLPLNPDERLGLIMKEIL
jgi:hypothetical protein